MPLSDWAKTQYTRPPDNRTLLRRHSRGELDVPVVKEGGRYYVDLDTWADRVLEQMDAAKP